MNRREFLKTAGAVSLLGSFNFAFASEKSVPGKPNIIFIFIDDMGYADLSCYGNKRIKTKNIDSLAADGIKFTQFYANAPVCSPSRVAVTTGQYPARWGIHNYLNDRQDNRERNMLDFLDPKAPTLARQLKSAGYVTAHFGKWHMGGGRDVDNAPLPQAYGFDESIVCFEGLGDRLLIKNDHLSSLSAKLGQGKITWVEKHEITGIRVDQTLDFIKRHKDQPFYINFWLNDVHAPFLPKRSQEEKFEHNRRSERAFLAVLAELDRQIGRLLKGLSDLGMDDKTLIIFTSDNGPSDSRKHGIGGDARPFRGRKLSLYEGGIRMPFIARWTGVIPKGKVDKTTVACGTDLFPTLCNMAHATLPQNTQLDGTDISQALMGKPIVRTTPIFWYCPTDLDRSPQLAIRRDDWKLLCNPDGSDEQLYNLEKDISEKADLSDKNPAIKESLKRMLLDWHKIVFSDKIKTYRNPVINEELADPAVLLHDGVYYLYPTGGSRHEFTVWTSTDLINWKKGPDVFRSERDGAWAPDVWRDPKTRKFYLYYTVDRTVGVSEADNPLGPFINHRDLFKDAIDANLFADDDGKLYLYYVQFPGFKISVQPMSDPVTTLGEPKVILSPKSDWEKHTDSVTEGPWMIKRGGKYYLMYSGSHAISADYATGYAVSDNPVGPFERALHNPIISRSRGVFGPGHGCAIQDKSGNWWHIYHQKQSEHKEWDRFICIDPIWFDEKGNMYSMATRGTDQIAPIGQ